jgi:S-adenosylmethionine decarboxylase proenzyme
MRELLTRAAQDGEMGVRTSYFYRFSPSGVSGVVIVSESHISVHTWPEKGYAALDVFVCGEEVKPEKAIHSILKEIGSTDAHVTEIKRLNGGNGSHRKYATLSRKTRILVQRRTRLRRTSHAEHLPRVP